MEEEIMRPRNRIIAATLTAVGLVAAGVGTAQANKPATSYQDPVVEWVSPVVHAIAADGSAVVHAKYQCSGGNEGTHLFIAVKQGPDVNATDHTSSEFAKTFYSTNYNSDGPGLRLNCDGRDHNASFVLRPDPYWANAENSPPPLHAGRAFVQFCLFDSTSSEDNPEQGFAFDYSMRKVVQN
jgi:hypothetical protein